MKQNKNNRIKELEGILVLCVALVAIYLLSHEVHPFLLILSIVLGILGISFPLLARRIIFFTKKFTGVIEAIVNKIILMTVFFVFVTPVASLYRLFGNRDDLQLKKRVAGSSYYVIRNHKYKPEDLENVW